MLLRLKRLGRQNHRQALTAKKKSLAKAGLFLFPEFPETRFLGKWQFPVNFCVQKITGFLDFLIIDVCWSMFSRYWCAIFEQLDANWTQKVNWFWGKFGIFQKFTGNFQPRGFRRIRKLLFLMTVGCFRVFQASGKPKQLIDNQLVVSCMSLFYWVFRHQNWTQTCVQFAPSSWGGNVLQGLLLSQESTSFETLVHAENVANVPYVGGKTRKKW